MSLEGSIIPPLNCERRLVLAYTKSEDTNKAPLLPRPRVTFAFLKLGPVVPYASFAYVLPVTVFGTRNVIVSGEVGGGIQTEGAFSYGARFHATLMKTVAEIATPFEEGEEAVDDLYVGSTFGVDLMAGMRLGEGWVPYAAVGFTDVSTIFYVGDDDYISNNQTPYAGLATSLGLDVKVVEKLSLAGEVYAALQLHPRVHRRVGHREQPPQQLRHGSPPGRLPLVGPPGPRPQQDAPPGSPQRTAGAP